MSIKVIILADGVKKDVTSMLKSVKWGGDVNVLPRKMEVSFQNADQLGPKGKRMVLTDAGQMVFLYNDSEELFRGFIFSRTIDQEGLESFTAYDELIYATKSMDTILVSGKTASEVITQQMKKFGIQIGSIQTTNYKIPQKLYQNQTLASIWNELLAVDKGYSGQQYQFFTEKGLSYLWTRDKAAQVTIAIDNIISGSNEVSIEDLRNMVVVTKGSLEPNTNASVKGKTTTKQPNFTYQNAFDMDSIKKYGYLVHYSTSTDDKATATQMKQEAKTLLGEMNKPLVTSKIDFIGDPKCITGRLINVQDTITGLQGQFYITQDDHTWEGGDYRMSLQISYDINLYKKMKNSLKSGGGVKWA